MYLFRIWEDVRRSWAGIIGIFMRSRFRLFDEQNMDIDGYKLENSGKLIDNYPLFKIEYESSDKDTLLHMPESAQTRKLHLSPPGLIMLELHGPICTQNQI